MRHKAVRVWWRPWRRRCACGCGWYPCPDAIPYQSPPVARSLGPTRNDGPSWDGPTLYLRNAGPLLTRSAQWRTRRNRR